MTARQRVVIIGGGFAGLRAARGLRRAPADVVLVDRANHHLFRPLLYQVATGLLPAGDIAPPLRRILAEQRNTRVLLGEATAVNPHAQTVTVTAADGTAQRLGYDHLVLAAGATDNYFGHDQWAAVAAGMKTLRQAVELRDRLLHAFETAAASRDEQARRRWLTFAIVGGGPTGVELAGQLAALARRTLRGQFHDLDPAHLRIVLTEHGDAVLAPFPDPLRRHAHRRLRDLGVDVRLGYSAADIDEHGITLQSAHGGDPQRLATPTVIWAAGVTPVPLTAQLAEDAGASRDHKGRIKVRPDCTVPGHPEIFAIGDLANVHDLPGIAEPALQQGRYVAKVISHRLGRGPHPGLFRYLDLGTMATISPFDAVADVRGLHLHGPLGKAAWAGVHLAFLTGWPNRLGVLANWAWTLGSGRRQQQLILDTRTVRPAAARPA
ncbi:NAD(P)/FAD-dependent oxidoreductase [Dactylosporangium aurantiacum]|uniref:NADH:ubiquinone reductase (non-electrogenic) n=1 Tax=Dactylosporangium aurantiacum TaxID=35754 RepID=A0A9Q9ILZ6_9ACTN|nr:NAD(P)/FAD-dependent oxidoreductase [Dactylosporangium aurantiacum]MDG6110417.1 NAD(P)/FAD-dependent oxidoreductase [Dactylosporangium aurantiacum]UWZ58589.1 NAD(P)/FAD-dependent oxidoreductase [Dactylosporangium aurantiacum]